MTKLNRDEILEGLLQTLVDGWGQAAVRAALDTLGTPKRERALGRGTERAIVTGPRAVDLVVELNLDPDCTTALHELAVRFDEGTAFPKLGDIRSFLLTHQRDGSDLKGRVAAFRRMLPVLAGMSPKGLEKLLSRSHHSGPADLGAISDAIRGAGESLRGHTQELDGSKPDPAIDLASSPLTGHESITPVRSSKR